jgi:hypothetical protein
VLGAWLVAMLALSCSQRSADGRPGDENASLGGDVAARVGAPGASEAIPLLVVASVADAQHVSAREAAKRVIDDEIAASAARRKGLDQVAPASWRLVSARAGFLLDRFSQEAKRGGPPTKDEIDILSERHWVEFARPAAVRVIHAIVMRPKDPANVERSRAVAAEIRKTVLSAADDTEFEANAKAVQTDLDTRVERLPAFTEEGWVTEGPGRMDDMFAKGAFAIAAVGGTSPVVESSFGWHVIRLRERIPEKMVPIEARRVAFATEAQTMRARELMESRLKALRMVHRVEVSPAAEQLMRSVSVSSARAESSSGASQAKVEAPQP